ncbi:hypothetical protein SY89_02452 [Halolamina pelagica]|uniref:Uncharacterized protein n=1 Tax=Halolamina pelagica TaxID=699431 RepID=A0A0P7HDH2_9EURY|nr:hypothetical protein SY89_02452 [Halolamina pelagica]
MAEFAPIVDAHADLLRAAAEADTAAGPEEDGVDADLENRLEALGYR